MPSKGDTNYRQCLFNTTPSLIFLSLIFYLSFILTNADAFSSKSLHGNLNDVKFNSGQITSIAGAAFRNEPFLKTKKHKTFKLAVPGGSLEVAQEDSSSIKREMLAEAIGTFIIVCLGCGSVSSSLFRDSLQLWHIASVWGAAVTIAIYCTTSISSAHLNPAISLAFAILRPKSFHWIRLFPYWAAQLIGATFAGATNFVLFRKSIAAFELSKGLVRGSPESVASAAAFGEYWSVTSWKEAFLVEAFGTALLSFVIFSVSHKKNNAVPKGAAPPLIGATIAALIAVLAPLTQAGFNPARDFGPRIVTLFCGWGKSVSMKGWWVYFIAPLLGAPIGAFIAELLLNDHNEKDR